MSLHQLANQMSAQGRGPDSTLVHMSPREVSGLQSLAMAHGGTLTINPETGLPEAGFLDSILPTLIGGAATYFTGGAITPMMAALGVGSLTALTSKDLGKGLMAGLGAYGGSGIAGGLMNFGANAIGSEAATAALPSGASSVSGDYDLLQAQASNAAQKGASNFDKLSRGVTEGFKNPMGAFSAIGGGSKLQGAATLGGVLSPLLAGETGNTVQTVTQRPRTGKVRPFTYDNYEQRLTPGEPYTAANGGLVSFAAGGPTYFADLIAQARNNPAYSSQDIDAAIARNISAGNVTQQQIDNSFTAAAAPANIAQGILGSQAQGFGASDINKGLGSYNFTPTQIQAGRDYISDSPAQAAVVSPTTNFQSTSTVNPQTGIAGLNQNIQNYAANITPAFVSNMGTAENPFTNINASTGRTFLEERIRADMASTGVNDQDVFNATGKTVAQLVSQGSPSVANKTTDTNTVLNPSVVTDLTTADTKYVAPGVGGATGAGQVGGGTTINPNGTITTSPRIPGIPVGGFTGMRQVRDAYTTGGGNLGYTSPTYTLPEFNEKYTNTGDSKAMYDYLMGKPGAKYPTKSKAEGSAGEIMRPYKEATLGTPVNPNRRLTWNTTKQKYELNPDYVHRVTKTVKDEAGNKTDQVTTYMSINAAKTALNANGLNKDSGSALVDWATLNNVEEGTVAEALGLPIQEVMSIFAKAKADKKIPAKNGGLMQLAVGGSVKADYIDSKGETHVWDWENGIYRPKTLLKNNKSYTWDKDSNEYKIAGAGISGLLDMTGGGPAGGERGAGNDTTTPIENNGFFANLAQRTTQPAAPVDYRDMYQSSAIAEQAAKDAANNAATARGIATLGVDPLTGLAPGELAGGPQMTAKADQAVQAGRIADDREARDLANAGAERAFDIALGKQTHINLTSQYEQALIDAADRAALDAEAQERGFLSRQDEADAAVIASDRATLTAALRDEADKNTSTAPVVMGFDPSVYSSTSFDTNAKNSQAVAAAADRADRADRAAALAGGTDFSGADSEGTGFAGDVFAYGGMTGYAQGGLGSLGGYSDGGRLLRGPGDGVSDSIPASIGNRQPARLADGEFVVPARIVSELGNGSTEAGARALYKMMARIQANRRKTTGKNNVAVDSKAHKYLPA